MNKLSWLKSAILISVISIAACSTSTRSYGNSSSRDALRTQLSGKRDLITINSLKIAPVTTVRALQVDSADLARFNRTLASAFAAESGIDVLSEHISSKLKGDGSFDAILNTEITRYAKDQGSALGTNKAALFAVSYSIVRKDDQKEIWTSNYFSTEHPESYNLIEVAKRVGRDKGTKMPTIEDLEGEAAHVAAVDFATRRVEQYTAH